MRWRAILREAWATTWSAKVSSALIAIVAAVTCFAVIATVGRSVAAASEIALRMEQAGARRLSVVDTQAEGFINDRTLSVVRALSTVESATALGSPFDAVNGHIGRGGTVIPVWPVLGDPSDVGDLVRGRWPQVGEALVSSSKLRSLGLAEPVGYLASVDGLTQYPIVGAFESKSPLEDLEAGALVVAEVGSAGRELRVVVDDVTSASHTVAAILTTLDPPDARGVQVESPTALAQTARDLNASMVGFGRMLLMLILTAGGVFVSAVVLADVLIRRRDLGRRRTLGITGSSQCRV